jgi:hypothetical protein
MTNHLLCYLDMTVSDICNCAEKLVLIYRSESIHKQGPPCFAHQADTILYVNLTVSTSVINDTMYHRHTSFHEFQILLL